jgi:diaminopimelate decarboxylase
MKRMRDRETPFYLYSKQAIQTNTARLNKLFSSCNADIFYAVKANTAIAVLHTIFKAGLGAEVVSPGELYIAIKAGFKPGRILYNNIARREEDIIYALGKGVRSFNFEALDQAEILEYCAKKKGKKIQLFARINPGIFPDTHPHLSTGAPSSKFGLDASQCRAIVRTVRAFGNAQMVGIHSHIGSQILTPKPFVRNAYKVGELVEFFQEHGITIQAVNLGGGFGIPYQPGEIPLDYRPIVRAYRALHRTYNVKIMLEPGRSVVGNAGYVLTRVISVKRRGKRHLYIVDAGMTENPRPALYGAYHHIDTLLPHKGPLHRARVAGPLCENSDEFGIYALPVLSRGEVLLIHNCGAYTRTMASNYNGRLLPAEYMYERGRFIMIRKAQQFKTLLRNEIY